MSRCLLSAEDCFKHNVVARQMALDLKEGKDGWWSMACLVNRHARPVRLHPGEHAHISWADLGKCDEPAVFKMLVGLKFPRDCLRKPKGLPELPKPEFSSDEDARLANEVLDIALGDGTPAERLVQIAIRALGGELPEGAMCDVLADRLGLKPRLIYQATAEQRRKLRKW